MRDPDYYTRLMLTLIAFMVAIETNAFFFFEEPRWECEKQLDTGAIPQTVIPWMRLNFPSWGSHYDGPRQSLDTFAPAKQAFTFNPEPGKAGSGYIICWQNGLSDTWAGPSREGPAQVSDIPLAPTLLIVFSMFFFPWFFFQKSPKKED